MPNTIDQPPTAIDGDKNGSVLAFNRIVQSWQVLTWNAVNPRIWPVWDKLPSAPELPTESTATKPAAKTLSD